MSLLTVIQSSCSLIGLAQPSFVVGNTDVQIQQLYAMANEEGISQAKDFIWQELIRQQAFISVAATVQTTGIPADFDRFIPNSLWDMTSQQPIMGPISQPAYQASIAWQPVSLIWPYFFMQQDLLNIVPIPAAGDTMVYSYVTANWVQPASGPPTNRYNYDTDVGLISERIIKLGIIWRFKSAKGLDYGEDKYQYDRELDKREAQNKGLTVVFMGRSYNNSAWLCPYTSPGSWPV